jgi:hypothetical protein
MLNKINTMNFAKLKYSNNKITDYDYSKKSNLISSAPTVNVEELWAQKHTSVQNFIPSLKGEFGKGNLTNKEINNIILNKRVQMNNNYFKQQ